MSPASAGARLQPLDHLGVVAVGHEADVLAVVLVGNGKAELARRGADFRLGHGAERKTHEIELVARRGEEEIALVAVEVRGTIERAMIAALAARHIVAGGERLGAELAGGVEKIVKLDRLVAGDTGHRRLAGDVARRETVDHRIAKALLVVENVVRDAEGGGDAAGIVNVLPGAAGALAVGRLAMVVELQGDADHIVAGALEQPRNHRGIDPARHGDDDASPLWAAGQLKIDRHAVNRIGLCPGRAFRRRRANQETRPRTGQGSPLWRG